jgi:hypothetical protein
MPAVAIYRVSVSGDNHSYVQWTECEGNTPPPRLINSRLRTIVFEAQGTGITPGVNCSISASAAATIEIIGVANSNCSGTGNDESLTTTTTIAITTTAAPTTTTTLAPATISLGYNVSSAATACGASPSNYYARNGYGLDNGTQLFTNSALTTFAPNGYYSNATNYAIITYAGILADKASCLSATTTTTAAPTTTTTTTTAAPTTTTTTTTTTTAAPTTTTTTTAAPTTTTTTTTTTAAPTTTTTTTTAAPTTTTTTTTTPPTSTLYVYAKDEGAASNLILYAGVNGAAGADIWDESIDGPLPGVTCGLIYTFTATLAPGDTVTFSTSANCVMAGDDSSNCPSATGGSSTFTTAYMVAGQNYVALGLNSSLFL